MCDDDIIVAILTSKRKLLRVLNCLDDKNTINVAITLGDKDFAIDQISKVVHEAFQQFLKQHQTHSTE